MLGTNLSYWTEILITLSCAVNRLKRHSSKFVGTKQGEALLDAKLSRLLELSPEMVPGVTLYTVRPDFVAATMNTGYQIELASKLHYFLKTFFILY